MTVTLVVFSNYGPKYPISVQNIDHVGYNGHFGHKLNGHFDGNKDYFDEGYRFKNNPFAKMTLVTNFLEIREITIILVAPPDFIIL